MRLIDSFHVIRIINQSIRTIATISDAQYDAAAFQHKDIRSESAILASDNVESLDLIHRRMSHTGISKIVKMRNEKTVHGPDEVMGKRLDKDYFECPAGKATKQPHYRLENCEN